MKLRKIYSVLSIVALTLIVGLLVGCSHNHSHVSEDNPVTITHTLGEINITSDINNIVVYDLGMLDSLDKLGLSDKVKGVPQDTTFPEYLESYKADTYNNVGGLKEVDLEAVMACEPDLIIISGRQSDSYDALSEIAPTLFVSLDYEAGYLNSIETNLGYLAQIFDVEKDVNTLLATFTERLEAVSQKVETIDSNTLVVMVSDRNIRALNSTSRCSIISNEAGFHNIATTATETHGDSVSNEYLLEQNPDFIFVLDRNAAIGATDAPAVAEVVENDLVKETNAYKNGNIVYLTPQLWYLGEGGLISTDLMIGEVETALGL